MNRSNVLQPVADGLSQNNESESIETQIMPDSANNMTADRAEALLRSIIQFWISQLMEWGGTTPDATCDCVFEEEPDLCNALGKEPVLALCEKLQHEEDSGQSAWYTVRFREIDKLYFDGHLGDYRVRAVYDLGFWWSENRHIDLTGRQIFLPVIMGASPRDMDHMLTEQMVNVATGATTDNDGVWLAEMERLSKLGAPVFKLDVGDKK